MLRSLRNGYGGPALRVRALAAVLVVCLIALAAPVVVPALRWLLGTLL